MSYQFKVLICIILIAHILPRLIAQDIQLLASGTNTSIRGISAVDDRVIWVSGSNGLVGKSVDSGKTFNWVTVKGFEKTDFRDIEAFDESSAIIMGIAAPAYILSTSDGGGNWKVTYENKTDGMFLDAMEFWNDGRNGIVVGDPLEGKFFMAGTSDRGMHWTELPLQNRAAADSGEGCFASSGTNIRLLNDRRSVFVSGGLHSNLVIGNSKTSLPVIQGKESTGANSVAVKDNHIFVVVGGDFTTKDSTTKNCFITTDAGKSWITPVTAPHGYRSCVEWLGEKSWISCGLNGVDYSKDEGNNWSLISKESFHVCRKAKKGSAVFFAGSNGRIGRLRGF